MKRNLLLPLFVLMLLLSACRSSRAQEEWRVYHAKQGSLVNPNFPSYAFEYPSAWELEESANHITFVSEKKLLKDPPEKLKSSQIIVGLSMNINMSPEEMVKEYADAHDSLAQFEDPVSIVVNGQSAAYLQGVNTETGEPIFVIATDIGENTRGMLTSRMATGEMEQWKNILFRMAQSLHVEK